MINYGAQFFKLTSYEIKMLYFSIKHMQFPLPIQVKTVFCQLHPEVDTCFQMTTKFSR